MEPPAASRFARHDALLRDDVCRLDISVGRMLAERGDWAYATIVLNT
jgi:hypothetical protein